MNTKILIVIFTLAIFIKSIKSFVQGYNQCQEDVDWELLVKLANKRYTEEDLMSAFNAGINNDYGNGPSFDQWLNSLNKQD